LFPRNGDAFFSYEGFTIAKGENKPFQIINPAFEISTEDVANHAAEFADLEPIRHVLVEDCSKRLTL
jgi:hypothetical protein